MRIPRGLAWLLIAMGTFTSGLLRQFHEVTPGTPFLAPSVGSLLFASVLFLALVAAREKQIGASPGPGVRVGSLTPLLLMLLFEKWISSSAYQPLFAWLAPDRLSPEAADAWFCVLCGVGLLGIVAIESRFSAPAAAWVAARVAPSRVVPGVGIALASIVAAYGVVAALSLAEGSRVSFAASSIRGPVVVVVLGQAALALGEEIYFRGLILAEMLRLLPRLGVTAPAARRWIVVVSTSLMFTMEHLGGPGNWEQVLRQSAFTAALGLLFGLLVLATANLWVTATLHAWIDWMLLGAAPTLSRGASEAGVTPRAFIFVALLVAFVAVYLGSRRRPG